MATGARPELADYGDREITDKTRHFADWITAQTGVAVEARSVQLAVGLDKTYRESSAYDDFRADQKRKRAEAEQARRQASVERRKAAIQARIDAEREKLAKLGVVPPADAEVPPAQAVEDEVAKQRTRKSAKAALAKKAAPAKRPAAKNSGAKKAPAKKASPAKKAAPAAPPPSDIDDDF
jgi:membrane protein involved in colicin uptake